MADLIVRGGIIVTPGGLERADVAIEDGRIQAIGSELPGANDEIDARGLHVFPALIDVHLHFNEPGRTEWEGAASGSRALAAGGGAVFFDMPLNSTPCTVNAHEFDRKRAALEAASITDFGLWGGLVPGNIGEMAELAGKGVVGFKAFHVRLGLAGVSARRRFYLVERPHGGGAFEPAGIGPRRESGDHAGPFPRDGGTGANERA